MGAMGAGKERGAVYVLFMNKDGSVKKTSLIASLFGWDHKLSVQVRVWVCVFVIINSLVSSPMLLRALSKYMYLYIRLRHPPTRPHIFKIYYICLIPTFLLP